MMFPSATSRSRVVLGLCLGAATLPAIAARANAASPGANAASPGANAAPPGPDERLRLEDVLEVALRENPEIAVERERRDAATERASASGRLPDLELMAQQWAVPLARPWRLDHAMMLMFGLRQTFPAPGSLGARERAGEQDVAMAGQAVRARELDLARQVAAAFADYYRSDREYRIHLEHAEISNRITETARANYQAGRGSQQDILRTMLERSRLHVDLATLAASSTAARGRLNVLMNREPEAPLGAPDEPPLAAAEPAREEIERALAERPEIKAAGSAVERSAATADAARAEAKWPSFMVGADYMFQPMDEEQHTYGASLSINLPWLNPRHREEVREAEALTRAGRRSLESTRNVVRVEIHEALARYRSAKQLLELVELRLVPEATRVFESERTAFAAGASDALRVLDALESLLTVRLDFVRSRARLLVAIADLERALGTRLPHPPAGRSS